MVDVGWAPREWNSEADALTNFKVENFDPALRIPLDVSKIEWRVLDGALRAGRVLVPLGGGACWHGSGLAVSLRAGLPGMRAAAGQLRAASVGGVPSPGSRGDPAAAAKDMALMSGCRTYCLETCLGTSEDCS